MSMNKVLDLLDTIEDVLLGWDLFKLDNDLDDELIEYGNAVIMDEKRKK